MLLQITRERVQLEALKSRTMKTKKKKFIPFMEGILFSLVSSLKETGCKSEISTDVTCLWKQVNSEEELPNTIQQAVSFLEEKLCAVVKVTRDSKDSLTMQLVPTRCTLQRVYKNKKK